MASTRKMQSDSLASCSVRVFWPFFDYFQERYGHGRELRLSQPFVDRDQRIPHARAMHMLANALQISGDPVLGLHVAEVASHGAFDVLDYVALTSRNLLEAFELTADYIQVLIHDGVHFHAEDHGELVSLCFALDDALQTVPAASEFVLATLALRFRHLVAPADGLVEVRFRHGAPTELGEHARIFGVPVRFSASEDAIVVTRAAAMASNPHWDAQRDARWRRADGRGCPTALAVTSPDGDDRASGVVRTSEFKRRVSEVVSPELRGGSPSIERVSELLHMSPRTVQRRLADEGTNFKELVDELRRTMAESYLQSSSLSLSEVSFLLGFANVNAFHRAFRRWTGKTPSLYRTGARR
jgi:AraC-like DNA-binding protein